MTHLFKLIFLTICLTFEPATSQCPVTSLPSGWNPINVPASDYCYAISNTKTNQATARQECSKHFKGFLARFHDVTSLRALSKKIRVNTKRIWTDLIAKSNGNWIWSDGTTVDEAVLNAYFDGDTATTIDNTYCGSLTDASTQKYSKWTSELCTANHEFICQALKLNTNMEDCVDSTFRIDNKCYAVTSEALNFSAAAGQCRGKFHGNLASLGDKELAITVGNYFSRKKPELKKVKIWLDIEWDKTNKRWQHSDGKKVTYYEENWYVSHKTTSASDRTNAMLDQTVSWKWKSWNPAWKAYAVCQVNSHESIKGKAVLPDLFTDSTKRNDTSTISITTTTAESMMNVGIDFKMLMIIVGAVGIVLIILIVIVCVLCYKKKACCKQRKKEENYSNGFGTPVSFNFTNPDYGNLSNAVTGVPAPATPSERPPALPPRLGDETTYATIMDEPLSPPVSTVDLLHAPIPSAYSTLSLARTTISRDRANDDRSTTSPTRVDYSSRISLNTGGSADSVVSRNRWNMTSFSNPEQYDTNAISPSYARMTASVSGDQSALQYAELNFGKPDEDEKFETGEKAHSHNSMTRQNESMSQQLLPSNGQKHDQRSITRQKFSQKYPEISRSGNPSGVETPNQYENEASPFVVSPDSPQFPL